MLFCDKLTVRFDKNYYLNTTDYELEIEYDLSFLHQAEKLVVIFGEALHKLDQTISTSEFCNRYKNHVCKANRFFQRKRSLMKNIG